jgi:hypothetical protein
VETRKFELCFVQPTKVCANAQAGVLGLAAGTFSDMEIFVVQTLCRAFDEKSHQYCLLAVKRNFFGLINRKWFLFQDVNTGVYYALESAEVASSCASTSDLRIRIVPVERPALAGVTVTEEGQTSQVLKEIRQTIAKLERTQAAIRRKAGSTSA